MKRLLCIITALDAGGAETFLMKVYRTLPKDYKLDFIVFRGNGVYESEVTEMGSKIYQIPTHSDALLKSLMMIKKIVKNNHYKNVLKMTESPIGVFDVIAAKMGGATNICVRSCNANSEEGLFKRILWPILRPLLNRFANVKVAPSELAGRFTFGDKEFDKGKVSLLYNGIDLNLFRYDEQKRNNIRLRYGIQDKYVVGNIGRFDKQKNHAFLLDVFSKVAEIDSNTILLLVGDGAKREELVEQATKLGVLNRIIFTGYQRDVVSYFSAMDVYVQTSFFEGMPNTVIEAQATGLPCIISDTITREANVTGNVRYISLADADEWVDSILSMKEFSRMDMQQAFIESGYDIHAVSKQFKKNMFD